MATGLVYESRYDANENRNYPFSESSLLIDDNQVDLEPDVFVDAILYPITSTESVLYLYRVNFSNGEVVVSMENPALSRDTPESEMLLIGSYSDRMVLLHDFRGRDAGVIICGKGWDAEAKMGLVKTFSTIVFSSSVCRLINPAWVLGFVGTDGSLTRKRTVVFKGDDVIRPELRSADGKNFLSFNAQTQSYGDESSPPPLRQLIITGIGRRVYSVGKQPDGSVLVTTPNLSRSDIRWHRMRDGYFSRSESIDICGIDSGKASDDGGKAPCYRPVSFEGVSERVVANPSETGNVSVVADDVLGLENAVLVSTVQGTSVATHPKYSGTSLENLTNSMKRLLSRPEVHGNGIMISIPGAGSGRG